MYRRETPWDIVKPLLFFLGSILWLEGIYRAFYVRPFFDVGLVYILLFSLPLAGMCALLTSLWGKKGNRKAGFAVLGVLTLWYMIQSVYHTIFATVLEAVRAAAAACRYQPFREDQGTGLIRHCLLRRGAATGQVMVVLVTAQPILPGAKNFVRALLAEAEKRQVPVTTIVQNYNPRRTSVVLGEQEKVLYGKGFILDELCGKTYALSPRSFYQVNPVQTAVLYGLAVEAAQLTGREVVLDAYCGIGTIGLTAADRAKQVVGVELNRDAVRDAIGNAKHNGVKNARFFAADATAWICEAAAAGERADVIFMDPPREGSTPQFIESVARMAPRRVVYVSCNPETMARDLALLTKKGYRAEGFTPVDMFPNSEHIEVVCALSRQEQRKQSRR